MRGEMLAGQMMDLESEELAALYTPENTTDCLKTENTAGGVLVSGVLKLSFVSPFTVPLLDSQISWSRRDSRVKQISFYSRTSNCFQGVSI